MSLDVTARLIDQVSRPGREATAALDRFGNTANRLASRITGTTRAVKGLASALQAVKTADGAADRATASTGRLRGTMAAIGPAARTSSTGLDRFGRAADRVAAASTRATASTRQFHAALGASLPAGGFAAGAESQLRSIVALQRKALDGMRRLNAGSGFNGGSPGGGGRRGSGTGHAGPGGPGMMGHAFFGATSGIVMGGHAIRELYEQGAQRVDEYQKMAAAGISSAQIARNRAAALVTSRLVGGSGINQNLATLRHLRFALGSDEEAERALTPVAQASQTMRWMNPEIDAEGNAFAMAKAAEMKGVSQDPAKFTRYMGLMANTAIATGGKTSGQDFRAFTAMSKGAATFLSEDAYAGLVSSIGGELGASKTGNALAMSTRAAIGGVMTKKGRAQLQGLGLWDAKAGTITKADDFQRDPHRWVEDNLVPVLRANGMLQMDKEGNVDPEKSKEIGKLFAKMFSNSNVASLFTLLTTQGRRYEKDQALRNKVAVDNFALQQKSPTFAMNAMTEAFKNMLGTMSEADMPQLVHGLNMLTGAFNVVAGMNPKSLGLVTEIGSGFLALGPAIWAARLAYMTFILPVRQLPMLLRGGATAMGIMRTETVAATVATNGLNASSSMLALTLGRVLAAVTAVSTGLSIGTFARRKLDEEQARSEDAGKSERAKQGGVMTAQRYLAQQNQVWNDPKTSTWGRFWAGQEAEKARTYLDSRGMPYEEEAGTRHGPAWGAHAGTGVPIAGARALGGPVGSGKSYLVGEHGPEVFTPGLSGAISTHAATKLALSGGGSASAVGDDAAAHEIRYMSFALVSAVDGVTRSIDRLGQRGMLPSDRGVGGSAGAAAGGGGAADGAPGGGRRAFMGRGGHFGAGAGGGEVTPGGRRVGPVTARGGFGRGMTAAKLAAASESFNFWRSKGATHAQAAAMVANEETESGFDPRAIGDGGTAHGIMQWHADRRRNIMRGAGIDIDRANHLQQLEGAYWEMTKGNERNGGRRFFAARNEHDAVDALVNHYERPADRAGNVRGRTAGALRWGSRFGEGAPMPESIAKQPAPATVPDSLADRARQRGARDKAADAARATVQHTSSATPSTHIGAVHIAVLPHPHQDHRQIAAAVHERFQDSVRSQLNDGAFA